MLNDEESMRVFDSEGTPFSDAEAVQLHAETQKLIDQTQTLNQQRIAAGQPDITMADALKMVGANSAVAPRTSRYRTWAISAEVETSEAETADHLSLRNYWAEDEEESPEGPHSLLPGGLGQITSILSRGLDIRLGQPVSAIRWGNDGVEAVTEQETFRADWAVVTLPLGVLKAGAVKVLARVARRKAEGHQARWFRCGPSDRAAV